MRVLLASNNRGKVAEYQEILRGHIVITPAKMGLPFAPEERDSTFLGNALAKARALRPLAGPDDVVLADDSGICVDSLGGAPGVRSARFGSPDGGATELPAAERNRLLLEMMRDAADRSARFVCCIVALLAGDRLVVAQEEWHGVIAESPSGAGGFGYDPIFYVRQLGRTAAELGREEKNRLSHRGRAAAVVAAALDRALALP